MFLVASQASVSIPQALQAVWAVLLHATACAPATQVWQVRQACCGAHLAVFRPQTLNRPILCRHAILSSGKTLLTFRSAGCRTMFDDQRGVAEPLNETMCGCRECNCRGLIVRGTHSLLLSVGLQCSGCLDDRVAWKWGEEREGGRGRGLVHVPHSLLLSVGMPCSRGSFLGPPGMMCTSQCMSMVLGMGQQHILLGAWRACSAQMRWCKRLSGGQQASRCRGSAQGLATLPAPTCSSALVLAQVIAAARWQHGCSPAQGLHAAAIQQHAMAIVPHAHAPACQAQPDLMAMQLKSLVHALRQHSILATVISIVVISCAASSACAGT